MSPPQANATITRVNAAGTADDWDRPAAGGAQKWAGSARAYYRERVTRSIDAGAVNVLKVRELVIETAELDAMTLDTDDVITFTLDDVAGTQTGTARMILRRSLPGGPIPAELQTSRIELEAA